MSEPLDDDALREIWDRNAEGWTRLARAGYDRCRDLYNTPTFLAMLPAVAGLAGLDIGCGEGHNTRLLADRGARMAGIDLAPTFIRHAREAERAEPRGISYDVANAAALPFPGDSFDFATAFMSMQDVRDQDSALAEALRVVRPGGFNQLLRTGFALEAAAEPTPDDETLARYPREYDARIIAYFLILRGRKPPA